jgi:sugar lactone lactonase YvrE
MKLPLIALAALATAQAEGQVATDAFADSARVARAAYKVALNSMDPATAYREITRASRAWPTQPAYIWGRAVLAARSLDTAATLRALDDYASLDLGRELSGSKDFAFLEGNAAFQALAQRHRSHRTPIVASRVVYESRDSTFWPEGIDFDPNQGVYYLAGVRHGTIMRVDPGRQSSTLWSELQPRVAVLGVRVDARRRVLWATTSGIPQREWFVPGDSAYASLLEVGLGDGRVKRKWDLPAAPGGHVLGDLAIGPHGDVFVTDSRHAAVYRLRLGTDSLETVRHPLFYSLQGVAPSPDGSAVYLADYSHGLLRMDLRDGTVNRLPDAPRSTSLGCDGLRWYAGALICVQNGLNPARIARFTLSGDGRGILRIDVVDRNFDIADEPTIGTIVGDEFVYVANSQWNKHDATGKRVPSVPLRGPVLLGVRIK